MNDKPFTYTSANGSKYESPRCDFRGGIRTLNNPMSEQSRMQDISEMIAYHVFNVYPELNGFSGYDTLRFI